MDISGNPSCGGFNDGQGVRYKETYKIKIIVYDNGAFLFENDVQERVIQMGLITKEEIDRNRKLFKICTITQDWSC